MGRLCHWLLNDAFDGAHVCLQSALACHSQVLELFCLACVDSFPDMSGERSSLPSRLWSASSLERGAQHMIACKREPGCPVSEAEALMEHLKACLSFRMRHFAAFCYRSWWCAVCRRWRRGFTTWRPRNVLVRPCPCSNTSVACDMSCKSCVQVSSSPAPSINRVKTSSPALSIKRVKMMKTEDCNLCSNCSESG